MSRHRRRSTGSRPPSGGPTIGADDRERTRPGDRLGRIGWVRRPMSDDAVRRPGGAAVAGTRRTRPVGSPASAPWRGSPPTRCWPCTPPATARSSSGWAPGPSSTWGAARGSSRPGCWPTGRTVTGVDYSADAVAFARDRWVRTGLRVAQMNALALGLAEGSFRWACSSHLIEHFDEPEGHVRRAGPGAGRRRDGLLPHPQRPGRLREPLPHPPVRARRAPGHARPALPRRDRPGPRPHRPR